MNKIFSVKNLLTAKSMFWLIFAVLLILMVNLSLDSGISGDEPVHYQHSEYVNSYFSSGKTDTSALNTPVTNLKYYGQLFDNISHSINQFLNADKPYVNRHILNSLAGALLILFTGLIAIHLGGYPAGILALLFMFLSPRILGHSFNNLKDIPFALGYTVAIWGTVKSMGDFPRLKFLPFLGICLGVALAFGIRAGGLILIPIVFLFSFLNCLQYYSVKNLLKRPALPSELKLAGILLFCVSTAYVLGILYWPYALQNPLKNPVESLKMMTHYEVSIRTVFNGKWYWSEKLPWFYGIKWIIISNPIVVLAGFVLQFIFIKKKSWLIISLLLFAVFFPIIWTIIKNSNLYGGWRHLLFIYPILVALSAAAWMWLKDFSSNRIWKVAVYAILFIGLIGPAKHIVKNHPLEYVYFNQLAGGTENSIGKYETDYYFHAVKPAMDWLDKYLIKERFEVPPVIASNFLVDQYSGQMESEYKAKYLNYYTRGKEDWDFAVISSTYIDPIQLKNSNWPPENAIFKVLVDDIVVCAVLKRETRDDINALKAYRKSDFALADSLYRSALAYLPKHETNLLYAAWTKRHLGDFSNSDSLAKQLLAIHPLSDNGRDLLARNCISQGKYNEAVVHLLSILESNYKYLPGYEQLGIAYDSLNNRRKQASYLEIGYKLGLRDSSTVARLVDALEGLDDKQKADKFRTILNKL